MVNQIELFNQSLEFCCIYICWFINPKIEITDNNVFTRQGEWLTSKFTKLVIKVRWKCSTWWRVFVPCWGETVWCSNVVYFPVLICFALYVSRKTRATPPPRVGLSVWMTEYPAGVIWPRLTVELLLHQVSVSARKSRWLSTISSYIESSLLLIERQFKVAHLVPFVDLTLEVCSSYWHGVDGCHNEVRLIGIRRETNITSRIKLRISSTPWGDANMYSHFLSNFQRWDRDCICLFPNHLP